MTLFEKNAAIPLYAKLTIYLICFIALFYILYLTSAIVVPVVFSLILAILLSPVVDFLVRKKFNRVFAIVIAVLLSLILISGLIAVIVYQISKLTDSWPQLIEKITAILNQAISEASTALGMNPVKIHKWIVESQNELLNFTSS